MIPAVRLTAPPIEAVERSRRSGGEGTSPRSRRARPSRTARIHTKRAKIGRRALRATACRARSTFDRDRDRISQEISHLSLTTFVDLWLELRPAGRETQRHTPRLHRRRGPRARFDGLQGPSDGCTGGPVRALDFDSDADVPGRHALGRAPLTLDSLSPPPTEIPVREHEGRAGRPRRKET